MIDLLEDAAGEALRGQRENAEGAEAEMADRRVGNEALHVFLHQADDGAIDDADERKCDDNVDDFCAQGGVGGEKRE